MKSFLANAKAVIIFTDRAGWVRASSFREGLETTDVRVEMHLVSSVQDTSFADELSHVAEGGIVWSQRVQEEDELLITYLENQSMGTRLFTCGEADTVKRLQKIATTVGFNLDEMYFEILGKRREKIFCAGCSTLNLPSPEKVIRCENCGRLLEVSSHYSKRLNAVLGYLTVPEQLHKQEVNFPENH